MLTRYVRHHLILLLENTTSNIPVLFLCECSRETDLPSYFYIYKTFCSAQKHKFMIFSYYRSNSGNNKNGNIYMQNEYQKLLIHK